MNDETTVLKGSVKREMLKYLKSEMAKLKSIGGKGKNAQVRQDKHERFCNLYSMIKNNKEVDWDALFDFEVIKKLGELKRIHRKELTNKGYDDAHSRHLKHPYERETLGTAWSIRPVTDRRPDRYKDMDAIGIPREEIIDPSIRNIE